MDSQIIPHSLDTSWGQATAHANSPMHTALRQFCKEFVQITQPLIDPIQQTIRTLEDIQSSHTDIGHLLPDIREIQHQFQGLTHKVQQQQAYVLIFGPLKSGKSTFMNATCAAYVSEVTSLPAYPCLVHVSHANTSSYVLYQYDGQTQEFEHQEQLHHAVEIAHQELTAALRHAEDNGLNFEPATHMPHAIRKIQVKLPLEHLEQSGAVLVDTPGLYSRMKFGYDLMTRDFRDAAACAVFIVKTDNLFLEQVFEEFHELLELFSRIFLVVNLDSTKKDLQPDGSLKPSLEHEHPEKIIEAFENLAMSAPLKKAAEQGRLQICPVDLLSAASQSITHNTHDGAPLQDTQDFNALRTHLTQYLNSSQYLQAFMQDSLRKANNLLDETHAITQDQSVLALNEQLDQLQQQTDKAQSQSQAIARLQDIDWNRHAQALRDSLFASMWTLAEEIRTTTGLALTGAIDLWFDSQQSLAELNYNQITALLNNARSQFIQLLTQQLHKQIQGVAGGLAVSAETLRDVVNAEINLDAATQQAAQQINPEQKILCQNSQLNTRNIPVKKSLWDFICFRSKTKRQDRFFGTDDAPNKSHTPLQKTKKLGQEGQQAMQKIVAQQLEALLNEASQTLPDKIFQDYISALSQSLQATLQEKESQTCNKLEKLTAQLTLTQNITSAIANLEQNAQDAQGRLATLDQIFSTAPEEQTVDPSPIDLDDNVEVDSNLDLDSGSDSSDQQAILAEHDLTPPTDTLAQLISDQIATQATQKES